MPLIANQLQKTRLQAAQQIAQRRSLEEEKRAADAALLHHVTNIMSDSGISDMDGIVKIAETHPEVLTYAAQEALVRASWVSESENACAHAARSFLKVAELAPKQIFQAEIDNFAYKVVYIDSPTALAKVHRETFADLAKQLPTMVITSIADAQTHGMSKEAYGLVSAVETIGNSWKRPANFNPYTTLAWNAGKLPEDSWLRHEIRKIVHSAKDDPAITKYFERTALCAASDPDSRVRQQSFETLKELFAANKQLATPSLMEKLASRAFNGDYIEMMDAAETVYKALSQQRKDLAPQKPNGPS